MESLLDTVEEDDEEEIEEEVDKKEIEEKQEDREIRKSKGIARGQAKVPIPKKERFTEAE